MIIWFDKPRVLVFEITEDYNIEQTDWYEYDGQEEIVRWHAPSQHCDVMIWSTVLGSELLLPWLYFELLMAIFKFFLFQLYSYQW